MGFLITSCTPNWYLNVPQNLKVAGHVSKEASSEIELKYGVVFNGIGWGSDKTNDLINMISLGFTINRKISINEAREIILDSINIYLDEVNKNEEIKPYIVNGYLRPSNLQIRLFIHNKNGGFLHDPDISVVHFNGKRISYATNDVNICAPFKNVIYETYEEALQKMQESGNSNLTN